MVTYFCNLNTCKTKGELSRVQGQSELPRGSGANTLSIDRVTLSPRQDKAGDVRRKQLMDLPYS